MYNFSNEYIIKDVSAGFPKFRQLPSGNYFVILSNGIYIYNYNFTSYKSIYNFKGNEIINDEKENNKTILAEIENNVNLYILCIVKNKFYLFDEKQNKIIYSFSLGTIQDDDAFYNLIPFKIIDNFLYFIVINSKKELYSCFWIYNYYFYSLNIIYYKIDINDKNNNNQILKTINKFSYPKNNYFCSTYYYRFNF